MYRTLLFATFATTLPFNGYECPPLSAAEPPAVRVDLPVLHDTCGKPVAPFTQGDTKVVVVAFLSFTCPIARDYVDPLTKLGAEYGPRGVSVIGVVSNDRPEAVAKQVAEYKVGFPVAIDSELIAADALKAGYTPEVVVLDADRVVRYRGRVDDKWGAKMKPKAQISRHDLREALDEILSGKTVTVQKTPCVGCEIFREKAAEPTPTKVTYHKEVLPILQNRCQECHRPGEAGPFSLLTYKEAVTWAADIKEYTQNRKMPPWKATGGMKFQHDRRLPATEIDTLAKWAAGGTPEGNPKDAPPARVFTKGWSLGEPDLVLTVNEDFHLGARGPDHYRCFVLPTGLTEDKFVVGYEVRPGKATVVHHVLNFFDTTGTARNLDREARQKAKAIGTTGYDLGPGYESPMGIGFTPNDPSQIGGLGGWAPGLRGTSAPAGTGMLLPKGADIVLQIHYHRNGKPEKDRTKIGLYFAKDSGAAELKRLKSLRVPGLVSASDDFVPFTRIPAGRSNYRVTGKVVLEEDCRVYAVLPHMHMLGANVRITMTPPAGKEQVIVEIGEWDYAWQEQYRLVEPLDVKAGTEFTVEAEYDNTAKNPLNPNSPPKDVKRGEGTTDEMLIGFLSVTSASLGGEVKAKPLADRKHYTVK